MARYNTVEDKLLKLKEIFNSDVIVTIGVQKKTGKIDLLDCERSFHIQEEKSRESLIKDKQIPPYVG